MERFLSILLVTSTATARKVVVLDNNEWDSVVVTTSPVKITNSRFNPKNNQTRPNARMLTECEEGDLKCLYDNQLHENGPENPADTVEKFIERFSGVTNVKINQDLKNASSKAYWNEIESEKHNHPYDDPKGWISLEPVPWSSSKVSKWKPNNVGDRPWMYGPSQQATSPPIWVTNGSNKRPSAQYGLASNDIITDNKPNGFPLDSGFQNHYNRPQVPFSSSSNNYRPQNSQYLPPPAYHPPQFSQPGGHYHFEQSTKQPYQWPQSTNFSPHTVSVPSGSYPMPTEHPPNHPESGNGQWVLLSTTKGYSIPQRYYDRKNEVKQMLESLPGTPEIVSRSFKSKYLENDIDNKLGAGATPGNRKSDTRIGETVWNVDGINIIRTGRSHSKSESEENQVTADEKHPAEMTYKRTVRLTVLPALNNTSTLSHDGMLEVDANPQTVEEAHQEQERMKKLQQIAVVSNARQPYQMLPIRARGINSSASKRKAAVLAAVGAGMIPATMAVLIPATLGRRRRRDVDNSQVFVR